jgi:hypothetical protein
VPSAKSTRGGAEAGECSHAGVLGVKGSAGGGAETGEKRINRLGWEGQEDRKTIKVLSSCYLKLASREENIVLSQENV